MRKTLLPLLALALADVRTVYAGATCGGSSGGGSSSGGSSSGSSSSSSGDSGYSSSSSSTESAPSAPACVDESDVHGFRHCTGFGTWATATVVPRIFIELGSSVRSFESGLADRSGSITHDTERFSYRVVMPASESQRDVAVMSTFRFGAGITKRMYAGVQGELGGLAAPASANAEMTSTGTYGAPTVQQGAGLVLGVQGIAGYRVSGKRGSLALEGGGGVRAVRYTFDSSYHNCVTTTTIGSTRPVAEASVRGELWLNPWIAAGAVIGANALGANDWQAGVFFGFHTRAFAGGR
jgi:hypothetical protein